MRRPGTRHAAGVLRRTATLLALLAFLSHSKKTAVENNDADTMPAPALAAAPATAPPFHRKSPQKHDGGQQATLTSEMSMADPDDVEAADSLRRSRAFVEIAQAADDDADSRAEALVRRTSRGRVQDTEMPGEDDVLKAAELARADAQAELALVEHERAQEEARARDDPVAFVQADADPAAAGKGETTGAGAPPMGNLSVTASATHAPLWIPPVIVLSVVAVGAILELLPWTRNMMRVPTDTMLSGGKKGGGPPGASAGAGEGDDDFGVNFKALTSLRALAVLHILVYYYYAKTGNPWWDSFTAWGESQIVFFFLNSGFILAITVGGKVYHCSMRNFDGIRFWLKRFARLYPTYILSVILMCTILPAEKIEGWTLLSVVFCVQGWNPGTVDNAINAPAWIVGSFFFLYIIFIPAVRILHHSSNRNRMWAIVLLYLASALLSGESAGIRMSLTEFPNYMFFRGQACAFLSGVALGLVYMDAPDALNVAGLQYVGASLTLALILAIQVVSSGHTWIEPHLGYASGLPVGIDPTTGRFLSKWLSHGLLIPLFGLLTWFGAGKNDLLGRSLLHAPPLVILGQLSFTLYLLMAFTYSFTSMYFQQEYEAVPYWHTTILCLVAFAVLIKYRVEDQASRLLLGVLSLATHHARQREKRAKKNRRRGIQADEASASWCCGGRRDMDTNTDPRSLQGGAASPPAGKAADSDASTPGVESPERKSKDVDAISIHSEVDSERPSESGRGSSRQGRSKKGPTCAMAFLQCLGFYVAFVVVTGGYFMVNYWIRQPNSSEAFIGQVLHKEAGPRLTLLGLFGTRSAVNAAGSAAESAVNILKWFIVLLLPLVLVNVCGHLIRCPWWPSYPPSVSEMLSRQNIKGRLFVRIVTSGKNPSLVKGTAIAAANVLKNMLHTDSWRVEVITDFPIGLGGLATLPVKEIVIPVGFSCPNGSLYRARALHYATCHGSAAQPNDWIVHLDEDTHFDRQCIRNILWHIEKEDMAVAGGQRSMPRIGQGIILYGAGEFENVITTLADSIRVANNFGLYQLQLLIGKPVFGINASFLVCPNSIERKLNFDWGSKASVGEETFFALFARARGAQFVRVGGCMYEQSPFTIHDFICQRRRWFAGLWLAAADGRIGLDARLGLIFCGIFWALSPLLVLSVFSETFIYTESMVVFREIFYSIMAAWCWCYVVGFMKSFSPRDGWARYFFLLTLQVCLTPFFGLLEVVAVVYAIIRFPTREYHVVKKEARPSDRGSKKANTSSGRKSRKGAAPL